VDKVASGPRYLVLYFHRQMAEGVDQTYRYNGCVYVPCNSARLAAGPFLGASPNWVERHLELGPDFLNVLDGDIAIIQRYDFDYPQSDRVVVIEKIG
jgi:hypothetical protein